MFHGIIGASNRSTSRVVIATAGCTSNWRCTLNTSNFTTKHCNSCKKEYPLNKDFWYAEKRAKDGFYAVCKDCHNERTRSWVRRNQDYAKTLRQQHYEANKEKILNQKKQYRINHHAVRLAIERTSRSKYNVAERSRIYRTQHPDRTRQAVRKYGQSHIKELSEAHKKWKREHRDLVNAYDNKRRAIENGAIGTHTHQQIKELYEHQAGLCFHCDMELNGNFHRDHWIPLSRGGSNWISNIRLLCPKCNLRKGNKLPHEWYPERYKKDE